MTLKDRLEVVKEITNLFKLERYVFLGATAVAAVITLIVAYYALSSHSISKATAGALFGTGGAVTLTGNRLIMMWSKSLQYLAHD